MQTNVVNLRTHQYDVYIGRSGKGKVSEWGNPFIVGRDGPQGQCIDMYESWMRGRLRREPALVEKLLQLRGKTLGCFCKPRKCHGDVLVQLISEYS